MFTFSSNQVTTSNSSTLQPVIEAVEAKKVGLFASSIYYGGEFYREFSQAIGSQDLAWYLPKDPILCSGICSGSAVDWIKFYCISYVTGTLSTGNLYTNEHLQASGHEIVAIQRAFRLRDSSTATGLIDLGMRKHSSGYFENALSNSIEIFNFINDILAGPGTGLISYLDSKQGMHTTCFFIDNDKTLYFSDSNKGDVRIPHPDNKNWLQNYCEYFHEKCGALNVSHFEANWNMQQEKIAMTSIYLDARQYSPNI